MYRFLVQRVIVALHTYAMSITSIHLSVTLVDCDHIVVEINRIGRCLDYLQAAY